MSEPTYEEVFESIRSSFVPKRQYEQSQKEIRILKSQLQAAENNAKELKSEYMAKCTFSGNQKKRIKILRAGQEKLGNEKQTLERKLKEISLKLEQKTQEYDSLLKTIRTDYNTSTVVKVTAQSQAIEQELQAIASNDSGSSTSHQDEPGVKTRGKRGITARDDEKRTNTKRRKIAKSTTRASKQSPKFQKNFSCEMCLDYWGLIVHDQFDHNPYHKDVPDPKKFIKTFSSFKKYKEHSYTVHHPLSKKEIDNGCEEKSCQSGKDAESHRWPHGDIICEHCGLSFKILDDHDIHMRLEHFNFKKMSNDKIYDLYLFSWTCLP